LAPLLVESALVARADGDWMGWSRLLLPGVAATFFAWIGLGRPVSSRWGPLAAGLAIAACGVWEPKGPTSGGTTARELAPLRDPAASLQRPLLTPFHEDLAWIVENVPEGGRIELADVGLVGNVPGIRVLDTVGLVDRAMAEYRASGPPRVGLSALQKRYAPGPDQVECLRAVDYHGAEPTPWDPANAAAFPVVRDVRYGAIWARYSCRDVPGPSALVVQERWRALAERYPSQAFLVARDRASPPGADGSFALGPERWRERGYALYWNQSVTTRSFRWEDIQEYTLVLDVDEPGAEGARVTTLWEPSCGIPGSETFVRERTALALEPPPCSESGPFVLHVAFTNDTSDGGDRNVYVAIQAR
jgi:hypothetical protein